jgi:2-(3-amino-3-carboxypropyl)histidine synthase
MEKADNTERIKKANDMALCLLPKRYDFEVPTTISTILTKMYKTVALQFPEGLQAYACALSDIINE